MDYSSLIITALIFTWWSQTNTQPTKWAHSRQTWRSPELTVKPSPALSQSQRSHSESEHILPAGGNGLWWGTVWKIQSAHQYSPLCVVWESTETVPLCVFTYFLMFLTFMLAVLAHERKEDSAGTIAAPRACVHTYANKWLHNSLNTTWTVIQHTDSHHNSNGVFPACSLSWQPTPIFLPLIILWVGP